MTQLPVYLTNASAAGLAALEVSPVGDRFEGTIDVDGLPEGLRQLFTDFEEVVEGQMFSLLDQIEERIRSTGLRVVWDDGSDTAVSDLQVFPSTRAVSFRASPPASGLLNGIATAGRPTSPLT